MDIWSRLIGGNSPTKKQREGNQPQQRLQRFKKTVEQLQSIWRRHNADNPASPELVLQTLRDVSSSLQNEALGPGSHLCARHVATFQSYDVIAQLAATYADEGIVEVALGIFTILLDYEDGDGFAGIRAFADALIGWTTMILSAALPIDLETRVLELLFSVASKLRQDASLLSTWFRPKARSYALPVSPPIVKAGKARHSTSNSLENSAASIAADKNEFPLFYLVLDYVHHDGKAGDFARTGLLYLMECAVHSASLEQWIIESDLATLMASGLGALYSQLSRKLIVVSGSITDEQSEFDSAKQHNLLRFNHSAEKTHAHTTSSDAEKTSSASFKVHLATFLSYLVFWQDALEHCSGPDVRQTLLDHFRYLFLQQLLYPSLIESSDSDGGSSVAVLTYLRCIIESIDDPDLSRLTFEYLLAISEPSPPIRAASIQSSPQKATSLARQRRADSLVANLDFSRDIQDHVPNLFNLDDMILSSLQSENAQTITATLRLASTLLRSHRQYDVPLIKTIKLSSQVQDLRLPSIEAYEEQMACLYAVIDRLGICGAMSDRYAQHLEDAQHALEAHACTMKILALPGPNYIDYTQTTCNIQDYKKDDGILRILQRLLLTFFTNDLEVNLALTQTFASLALCPYKRLYALIWDSSSAQGDSDDVFAPVCDRESDTLTAESRTIYSILLDLIGQFTLVQQNMPALTDYIVLHQKVLNLGNEEQIDDKARHRDTDSIIGDAVASPPSRPPKSSVTPRTPSPKKKQKQPRSPSINPTSGPLRTPPQNIPSSTPLPSPSPRGRDLHANTSPSLLGRLSHLRLSQSPSPAPSSLRSTSRSKGPTLLPSVFPDTTSNADSSMRGLSYNPEQIIKIPHILNKPPRGEHQPGKNPASSQDTMSSNDPPQAHEGMTGVTSSLDRSECAVSLGQFLTNTVILQEFVLELAAICQVRASLFGENAPDSQ